MNEDKPEEAVFTLPSGATVRVQTISHVQPDGAAITHQHIFTAPYVLAAAAIVVLVVQGVLTPWTLPVSLALFLFSF